MLKFSFYGKCRDKRSNLNVFNFFSLACQEIKTAMKCGAKIVRRI